MDLRLPSSVIVFSSVLLLSCIQGSWAQIVPDRTLGAEQSVVVPDVIKGLPSDRIDGGAVRGSLLFHSFEDFNIGEGQGAYFSNPDAVNAIFSRVTGNNPSNLFGKLGVLGDADLVFLNTNGVLFGPNASLDLTGSFAASTASDVIFPDGQAFGTSTPGAPDILTVNVEAPVGLVFEGIESGDFTNQANLAVQPGETLMLQGATTLHSGSLTAPGGEVRVLGDRVGLIENAEVDVSRDGAESGGVALIGGDLRGQGEVPTATRTFVGKEVEIRADGGREGDGGRVIVWADEVAGFYGNVSATGGNESGDGGFVEVSGKETLIFEGDVDVEATVGEFGMLLLDPRNILISDNSTNPAEVEVSLPDIFSADFVAEDIEINARLLEGQRGIIVLEADDDIRVQDSVSLNLGSGGLVTLKADANADGVGSFSMAADQSVLSDRRSIAVSGVDINFGPVSLKGGNATLAASRDINFSQGFSTNDGSNTDGKPDGNLSFKAGRNLNALARIDGDRVAIEVEQDLNVQSIDADNDGLNVFAGNDITVTRIVTGGGSFGGRRSGDVELSAEGRITISNIDSTSESSNEFSAGHVNIKAKDDVFISGRILTEADDALPGNVSIESEAGSVTLEGGISTRANTGELGSTLASSKNAGFVNLKAAQSISLTSIETVSEDKIGGKITIESGSDVSFSSIVARGDDRGGDVIITSDNGNIDAGFVQTNKQAGISLKAKNGAIESGDLITNGQGGLELIAQNNISASNVSTTSSRETAGDIQIISREGDIYTEILDSSSGNVAIFSRPRGGNITIEAQNGDVRILNANSSGREGGGEISILTGGVLTSGTLKADGGARVNGNIGVESGIGDIVLKDTIANNLTVKAEGAIEGQGILKVTGDASFTSNLPQAGTVTVRNTLGTTLGDSFVGGNLVLDSAEPIEQEQKAVAQVAGSIQVNGEIKGDNEPPILNTRVIPIGTRTLPDGSVVIVDIGTIELEPEEYPADLTVISLSEGVTEFGEVFEAPAITLNQDNAFDGTLSFKTNLDEFVTASAIPGITQLDQNSVNGRITVNGSANLRTSGGSIKLINPNNDFNDVQFAAHTVDIHDQNALNLLESSASGNLNLSTGGRLSQSAPLSVDGETSINTSSFQNHGDVVLHNDLGTTLGTTLIGRNFSSTGGPVTQVPGEQVQIRTIASPLPRDSNLNDVVTGSSRIELDNGDVIIRQVGPVELEEETFAGNLTVNSLERGLAFNGDVDGGEAINLSNADNRFSGPVRITTDAATLVEVSGTPGITQSGPITVPGSANFRAVGGDVTLNSNGNEFTGVKFTARDVALQDDDATQLLLSDITGNLSVVSGGDITQEGDLVLDGNARFESTQPDGSIVLDQDNQLSGTVEFATAGQGDVTLRNTIVPTRLGSADIDGNFNLNSGLDVLQDEAIQVAGQTTINSRNIFLSNPDNDLNVLSVPNGNNLVLAESNDITIQDSQVLNYQNAVQPISLSAGGKLSIQDSQLLTRAILQEGGQIKVDVGDFELTDGSFLMAIAQGEHQAGNVEVTANNSISVEGFSAEGVPTFLGSLAVGDGVAGNVVINSQELKIQNGGFVSSSSFGNGKGGNVEVDADLVKVGGVSEVPLSQDPSDLLSLPSNLSTDTFGTGAAGSVNVRADRVEVNGGGTISATTWNTGEGGRVSIDAQDVNVSGIGLNSSGRVFRSSINARAFSLGNAGGILMEADTLNIEDLARVSTSNGRAVRRTLIAETDEAGEPILDETERFRYQRIAEDLFEELDFYLPTVEGLFFDRLTTLAERPPNPGEAGDVDVNARVVSLNNEGSLIAQTRSGEGGDINLDLSGLLLLRNGSFISTTAGTSLEGGNGGNIDINARDGFIFGVRQENSDIFANAFTGDGGNINIATQNIFGLKFRPRLTAWSDITASSEFGLDGTVTILTPNIDPTRGLNQLQPEPRDSDIDDGCQVNSRQGTAKYFDIGLGGTPPGPEDFFQADNLIATWIDLPSKLAVAIENHDWSDSDEPSVSHLGRYPAQSYSFISSCLRNQSPPSTN